MALFNNNALTATTTASDTVSLLSFANDASTSIKEAFSKPVKTRKVNIRKLIQKRVGAKRLNDTPASSKGVRGAKDKPTKGNLASNKPPQRPRPAVTTQLASHSQSLPVLSYQQTTTSSFVQPSYSESVLYPQMLQPVENPDSSLDEILTMLGLESSASTTPTMSRCSSDSPLASANYVTPSSQSILESQLPLAEHPLVDRPFSPLSDCSDELFEDSAYSSPCSSSSSRSYNCSPLPPVQGISTGCEWTPAQSSSLPCSQYPPVTSACNWMAGYGPQCATAGFGYLAFQPSPPCDQMLLSPTAVWDSMSSYPEYF